MYESLQKYLRLDPEGDPWHDDYKTGGHVGVEQVVPDGTDYTPDNHSWTLSFCPIQSQFQLPDQYC